MATDSIRGCYNIVINKYQRYIFFEMGVFSCSFMAIFDIQFIEHCTSKQIVYFFFFLNMMLKLIPLLLPM